jgi:hypothetical protein
MQKLEIGHRYRKVSAPSIIWQIVGYRTDRDGIPHVRLVSVSDQTRCILIAESVVGRADVFAPVHSR